MESTTTKKDQLVSFFEKLAKEDPEEAICVWDNFLMKSGDPDLYIEQMDNFNEFIDDPWQAVRSAYFGDFCPYHEWFWFNGLGNLESSDSLDKSPYDPDELADYWLEHEDVDFYRSDEIDEILRA